MSVTVYKTFIYKIYTLLKFIKFTNIYKGFLSGRYGLLSDTSQGENNSGLTHISLWLVCTRSYTKSCTEPFILIHSLTRYFDVALVTVEQTSPSLMDLILPTPSLFLF